MKSDSEKSPLTIYPPKNEVSIKAQSQAPIRQKEEYKVQALCGVIIASQAHM